MSSSEQWSFMSKFSKANPSATSKESQKFVLDQELFEKVKTPNKNSAKGHAIFDTLAGETLIESYEIYRPKTATTPPPAENENESGNGNENDDKSQSRLVLVATVDFGNNLNGHGGIVHGGIQSMMFDDVFGWGCNEVIDSSKVYVTANLSVNFRKPVMEGSKTKIEIYLEKQEGRKYFWKAKMLGKDGSSGEEVLYADATSLYILLKDKK